MKSGEHVLFEAHLVRGRALADLAQARAAFGPLIDAWRKLGADLLQASRNAAAALGPLIAASQHPDPLAGVTRAQEEAALRAAESLTRRQRDSAPSLRPEGANDQVDQDA